MEYILITTDIILYILFFFPVIYIFFFSIYSFKKSTIKYKPTLRNYRFVIFIPAYKEDSVIEKSVDSILSQRYDSSLFDVVVISDGMSDEVNKRLFMKNIVLIVPELEKSSKVNSLQYAVNYLNKDDADKYDIAVIIDSDNLVEETFLKDIASAFDNGMRAVQAHRTAKKLNSDMAILDAASEEINNSIFRYAQVKSGHSAALSGSGMAFDYKWFCNNIFSASTAGEDKELERMLLKEGIFIDYLDNTLVYDEKVSKQSAFYSQRRRWIAAQWSILKESIKDVPDAIADRNTDYLNKIFQWMILPRILLIGLLVLISIAVTILSPIQSVKWWILLLLLVFSMAFALPDYLVTKQFKKAIRHLPFLFVLMVMNLFRLRNANKNFIHTQHGS